MLIIDRYPTGSGWIMRADFSLLTEPGNERLAMERVAKLVREAPISATKVERLKTAVAEITMNAMEHVNQYRSDLEVKI